MDGYIERTLASTDKPCSTYYRVVGDVSAQGAIPLVCIHGGPGMSHLYMTSIDSVTTPNRPIIYYDQLGGGKSTHFPEKINDVSFWTEELFLDELASVLAHFGLGAKPYDMLGHSWGGYLATAWAARKPSGLRKLICWSPHVDLPAYNKDLHDQLQTLGPDVSTIITTFEEAGRQKSTPTYTLQQYLDAVNIYNAKYNCHCDPLPECLGLMMQVFFQDMTANVSLTGGSPCSISGIAQNWSTVDRLHMIDVPTLVINTSLDKTGDALMQPILDHVETVKWQRLEKGGHFANLDAPELFHQSIVRFLDSP